MFNESEIREINSVVTDWQEQLNRNRAVAVLLIGIRPEDRTMHINISEEVSRARLLGILRNAVALMESNQDMEVPPGQVTLLIKRGTRLGGN